MSQLVDGAVATGEGAFIPGQAPHSPDWPAELAANDEENVNIDPILLGPAGHVAPPLHVPRTPPAPCHDESSSDMDDAIVIEVRMLASIHSFAIIC